MTGDLLTGLVSIGWVAAVLVAGRWAGRPVHRSARTRTRARRGPSPCPGPLDRLGAAVRVRCRVDDGALSDRTIGLAVVGLPVVVVVQPMAAVLLVVGLVGRPWWRSRAAARRHRESVDGELSWLAGLVRVGVGAGLPVGRALDEAAARGTGPGAAALSAAWARTSRGVALADAVDGLRAEYGEDGRPLVAALVGSIRYGAPIGPALDLVAADLRLRARRRAEVRARRVPVRMLFPLVTCILPAFVLLSVVPMVATSLRDLGYG